MHKGIFPPEWYPYRDEFAHIRVSFRLNGTLIEEWCPQEVEIAILSTQNKKPHSIKVRQPIHHSFSTFSILTRQS
jgi:hypothetical protein